MEQTDFSQSQNYALTIGFMTLTCLISIATPNVTSVLSIVGGLCSVSICFLLPAFCYVRLSGAHWTSPQNLKVVVFFGIFVMAGYSSLIATTYQILSGTAVIGKRDDIRWSTG